MDEQRFDELTKRLAGATSRRQVLKALGAGLVALVAGRAPAAVEAAPGRNDNCAQFCAATFGADTPAANQCTSEAAKGRGLCYSCGPASSGGTKAVCCAKNANGTCTSYAGATCPPLQTDVANCGACGRVCTAPANATATCVSGTCGFACNDGFQPNAAGTGCEAVPLFRGVCVCVSGRGDSYGCQEENDCGSSVGRCDDRCNSDGGIKSYTCVPCA